MNLVIDTNIIISALIKDSLTRALILNTKYNLIFPSFIFEEIKNHKKEIVKKSKLSDEEFEILFSTLINYVKIIPIDKIVPFKKTAYEIIGKIDEDDVIFIATALAYNAQIWSDDKDFQKQDRIQILTTKEIKESYDSEINLS